MRLPSLGAGLVHRTLEDFAWLATGELPYTWHRLVRVVSDSGSTVELAEWARQHGINLPSRTRRKVNLALAASCRATATAMIATAIIAVSNITTQKNNGMMPTTTPA